MINLVGKAVKSKDGIKQVVFEVDEDFTYCIKTMDEDDNFRTFTREGFFSIDNPESDLNLIVDSKGKLVTFDSLEEELPIMETTVEEELPIGEASFTCITPYEASLKTTKLELLAELTGLVENNTSVGLVILKVKKLRKLLEL